jgi:hypothetical protein
MQCLSYIFFAWISNSLQWDWIIAICYVNSKKVYSNVYPYNYIVAPEQMPVSVQNHKQKSATSEFF